MKLDLKNYDSSLLEYLTIEIRIDNYKIAVFNNMDDLIEYIETIPKFSYKKNKWFVTADNKIVFNFIELGGGDNK